MGAKTWMLVYATGGAAEALRAGPRLDRDQTLGLAADLFSRDRLEPIGEGDLSRTCPPDDEVHLGCFAGVSIAAAKEFAVDYPSKLPAAFLAFRKHGSTYLHAMHSAVDWLAFAQWRDGELIRSLSLSPDSGILEDLGQRLRFEEPFWSGRHAVVPDSGKDYPLPFHPLELGEAALQEFFGYQLEGMIDPVELDPESVPLLKFRRRHSRWKFW